MTNKPRIYLDHAATSPAFSEVIEAVHEVLSARLGNPSSVHAEGRHARTLLEEARSHVAAFCGVCEKEVIFTSGGTESNAIAIQGVLAASVPRAPLIVSVVEHDSVLAVARRVEGLGRPVIRIGVNRRGGLDLEALKIALEAKERPALVSIMAANNETGTIFPAQEIAALCERAGVPFHTDAVQLAGKLSDPLGGMGAGLVSLAGHKLAAPQGIGVLLFRDGTPFLAPLGAGHQERGLRGGTENLSGIVGFGVAARIWLERGQEIRQRMDSLGEELSGWLASLEGVSINASEGPRVGGTMSARFDGLAGEALLQALDLEGVAASLGAACASGSVEPSHVLLGMGYSRAEAGASVRFSLGWSTRPEDIAALRRILPPLISRLRENAARYGAARAGKAG